MGWDAVNPTELWKPPAFTRLLQNQDENDIIP